MTAFNVQWHKTHTHAHIFVCVLCRCTLNAVMPPSCMACSTHTVGLTDLKITFETISSLKYCRKEVDKGILGLYCS